MSRSPLPPPLVVPRRTHLAVLLSVPHSGHDYPDWLVQSANAGLKSLIELEDPLVDRLAWRAIADGHGAIIARAPRAAIDCNRGPDEVDPLAIRGFAGPARTHRAAAGLGIIPSRTASHGHLWRSPLDRAELERRLDEAHRPFHRAIESELDRIVIEHGTAILLDCHSMPPRRHQPELVIGNRHGTSAAAWIADEAGQIARAAGWTVALNDPYAGGHVVERHGNPNANVHALQLEIDRRCYCAGDLRTPGPGFDRASRLIAQLASKLGEIAIGPAIAAE